MSNLFFKLISSRPSVISFNRPVNNILNQSRACANQLVKSKFDFDEDENFEPHKPLFCKDLVRLLNPVDGQIFIDMTFGSGGHSKALLETGKDIKIIGMDRDPLAYKYAVKLSQQTKGQVIPLLAKFSELPEILKKNGFKKGSINGIIMELGPSSMQMQDASRGFSLNREGPLDMRMDGKRSATSITADDVINTLEAYGLARIFKVYGDERNAMKYGQAIVDCRYMMKRISTTTELANLIDSLAANKLIDDVVRTKTSANKVFRALRIFVNNELNELNYALTKMRDYLHCDEHIAKLYSNNLDNMKAFDDEISYSSSGKLAVISLNVHEDTLVKRHLQGLDLTDPLTQTHHPWYASSLHSPTDKEMSKVLIKKWYSIERIMLKKLKQESTDNPKNFLAKMRVALRVL